MGFYTLLLCILNRFLLFDFFPYTSFSLHFNSIKLFFEGKKKKKKKSLAHHSSVTTTSIIRISYLKFSAVEQHI